MNTTKLQTILLALLLLACGTIFSQTDDSFEAFRQQRNQNFRQYQNQNNADFYRYRDSLNSRFARHIAQKWEQVTINNGIEQKHYPKPSDLPQAEPKAMPQEQTLIPVETLIDIPQPSIPAASENQGTKPRTEPRTEPLAETDHAQNLLEAQLDFCKSVVDLKYAPSFLELHLADISEKQVAQFWEALSQNDYALLMSQISETVAQQQLNDMGRYELVAQTAKTLFPDNEDEQIVCTVFLLNQYGFKAKIAKTENHLVCLLPVQQQLFSRVFVRDNDLIYYVFETDINAKQHRSFTLYTYNELLENCTQVMDMNIYVPLKMTSSAKADMGNTKWGSDTKLPVNVGVIDFYKNYPQTEFRVYADAEMNTETGKALLQLLQPQIEGVSPFEAVSFILHFMHTSFPYKTDQEQFGYEKTMFCEEALYYPYTDCEDNAILFAFLVRKLVGLEVVLLDYPQHIAAAVHFPEEVNGDYVMVAGKKFTVCDPTYFGASVGMSMPQPDNASPTAIVLRPLTRYEK